MEERTHLFEYGIVAVLIYQALSERARNGRRVRAPAVLALVATVALGWIDEGLQALIPNRVYDNFDVVRNSVAAMIGIAGECGGGVGWGTSGWTDGGSIPPIQRNHDDRLHVELVPVAPEHVVGADLEDVETGRRGDLAQPCSLLVEHVPGGRVLPGGPVALRPHVLLRVEKQSPVHGDFARGTGPRAR